MKSMGHRLRKATGRLFDMPADVVFELPRLTMIGNRQLYIENHRGVKHFTSEQLTIYLEQGELVISGESLIIRTIWTDEVFVEGVIKQIEMNAKGGSQDG